MSGNGAPQHLEECSYNPAHKFTSLNARYEHEPSCVDNPGRVSESENPERD